MQTAICIKCKKEKPLHDFYKKKLAKSGHYSECIECLIARTKKYGKANPEKRREASRKHYYNNKGFYKNKQKIWTAKNPDYSKIYNKKYRTDNLEYYAIYQRLRRLNDEGFRLACRLRARIRKLLRQKGVTKKNKTIDLLGCDLPFLKNHIESLFKEEMSWKKFHNGEIHVDHKKPCASFDLTDIDQQKICFHYSNLQPLWAIDNLKKGD